MKNYLLAGTFLMLIGCNNAAEDEQSRSAPATDTVLIDVDSAKNPKSDGTAIDATVLDTTVKRP